MTLAIFPSPADPTQFIRDHTALHAPPLVPELPLYLASEVVPLWQMTEEDLSVTGLPPPYWAFAWAGGQALARYVLDQPALVAGRCVLDFAAGSGLVAIAAMKAGAARAIAADIDPFAGAAIDLNAAANGVSVERVTRDLIGTKSKEWDVVLAGDICYERPLAERVEAWLRELAQDGATVLLGDPGRSYLPRAGLEKLTAYAVQTSRELEDMDVRHTCVWRVLS